MTDAVWVVWCSAHREYLVYAGVTGTTWTANREKARRFTKTEAAAAVSRATWLDHDPVRWAIAP